MIRGPALDMTVRRKERILGIWVNREQVAFTRTARILLPRQHASARRHRVGARRKSVFAWARPISQYATSAGIDRVEADAFRAAAIRDRKRERLYWESPTGIEFLSRTLFRARIPGARIGAAGAL